MGTATTLQQQNIEPNFVGNGQPKATAKAFLNVAKKPKSAFCQS